jgi:hypothetical protein
MLSTSETFADLASALSKAQGAFPAIKKDNTAQVRGESKRGEAVEYSYSYADLASILEAIRKPLAENGLSIIQPICPADPEHVWLVTRLIHSSGQWIESAYPVDVYERPQEMGSAITYARRYALTALLGIAAEEDDDGAGAQRGERKSQARSAAPGCPKCGTAESVIRGKEEFGGGWLCWKNHKKRPGCGHKWQDADATGTPEPGPDKGERQPGEDESPYERHGIDPPAKAPSATPACAHCGSVRVKAEPKAPGYLVCSDCGKGTKRG